VRFFHKKTVILVVAVLTVFLLANYTAQGKHQFAIMERVTATLLAPVEYVFAQAGYSIRQSFAFTGKILSAYHDNESLRAENAELKQQILNDSEILAENARLRVMLDYKKAASQFDFVAAAVIARDPGTWTNIIIINRGTNDGLTKDMPVVTPQGLVGNITNVYANSAKVQLILDSRSAVGALVQRQESRVAGIVEGNSSNMQSPRMVNLARDADIIKGDKIVTSGFGGIYPKGLLIGETLDVINDEGGLLKYAILKPAVDFDKLEEVLVIVRSREPAPKIGRASCRERV
jgi:rod shape-determining protein MreC